MKATILPLLLGGALLCAGAARAADVAPPESPKVEEPKPDDAYIVTLQAIGGFAPSFPGSRELSVYPFPGINVRGVNEPERFTTPDDSFSLALLDVSGFRAGPVGNFVFYRESIPGVHQVALTHEVGGFAEYGGAEHFRARSELRQGVDGHKGFVASFGADAYAGAQAITLSFGPRLSFGNNRYANAYYSVTPFESLASGGKLEPYQATGGFTAAGGMATLRYDFTPSLSATAYGGLQRLTGSVGSSPIPNVIGSRDQFSAGLSISRSFEVQKFW
ncbi:MAG TPA: MipA/OmpV family protein [Methylocystis sp.]|nr:MipA/OmpV family protein [Methylocystis sp.]